MRPKAVAEGNFAQTLCCTQDVQHAIAFLLNEKDNMEVGWLARDPSGIPYAVWFYETIDEAWIKLGNSQIAGVDNLVRDGWSIKTARISEDCVP